MTFVIILFVWCYVVFVHCGFGFVFVFFGEVEGVKDEFVRGRNAFLVCVSVCWNAVCVGWSLSGFCWMLRVRERGSVTVRSGWRRKHGKRSRDSWPVVRSIGPKIRVVYRHLDS